jgi:hypothetical protein
MSQADLKDTQSPTGRGESSRGGEKESEREGVRRNNTVAAVVSPPKQAGLGWDGMGWDRMRIVGRLRFLERTLGTKFTFKV